MVLPDSEYGYPTVVYCGHGEWASIGLSALLASGVPILGVLSHPGKTYRCDAGVGEVAEVAEAAGLPCRVIEPKSHDLASALIRDCQPDVLMSICWRALFPEVLLGLPRLGALNLHGSLLPKYRGRAPITWAMLEGQSEVGLTVHLIDAGMDSGAIVEQVSVSVGPDETIGEVFDKLTPQIGPLLIRALSKLSDPQFVPIPQDHAQATVRPARQPEDGLIDWCDSAIAIHNQVRALSHPLPGARTCLVGRQVLIWRSRRVVESARRSVSTPGTVLDVDGAQVLVQCGQGILALVDLSCAEQNLRQLHDGQKIRPGMRFDDDPRKKEHRRSLLDE